MLKKEALFYTSLVPFIVFFICFPTILYPAREFLHLSEETATSLMNFGLPLGVVAAIRNWTYSLFYVFAELWGSVALSLLFWGFANEITKVTEAKRFYALFALGANIALLVVGPTLKVVAGLKNSLPASVDALQVTLNYVMSFVTVAAFLIIVLYRWMNKNVLTDPKLFDPSLKKPKKKKVKMSLTESFAYIFSSKYLMCIAALVIAYGISIVLIEVTWKNQLKIMFPDPNDYLSFVGDYTFYLGAATIFMILFVSSNVLRRFGWGVTAQITPIVLLITGVLFFTFIIFNDFFSVILQQYGITTVPLMIAVIFGTIQNIMSKSCKYSLFDPTKEMSYIPLDDEVKVKGKAAIDVVGARIGKAGGSVIQIILFTLVGPLAVVTPYIGAILFIIIGTWIFAAKVLNEKFIALSKEKGIEI